MRATIESLIACDPPPDEIIVVDGDASEETRAVLGELQASTPARFVYLPSRRGLTLQRNVGLAAASSEIVVFFDDDINFTRTPDLFRRLQREFSDTSVVGVTGDIVDNERPRVGGRRSRIRRLILGRPGTFTRFGYVRYIRDARARVDVEYMPGGLMTARRTIALDVGFDERLTGYAVCEDEDFSYRLSKRGRIRYAPDIAIEHERYGERDPRSVDRSLVVNRTYLFRKNFPQTPSAKATFVIFIAILLAHRAANREWSALRGLVEGIGDVVSGRLPNVAGQRVSQNPRDR